MTNNEVVEKPPLPVKSTFYSELLRNVDCSQSSKPTMANRLLDWFSVIMADSKRRRLHPKSKGTEVYLHKFLGCMNVCVLNMLEV